MAGKAGHVLVPTKQLGLTWVSAVMRHISAILLTIAPLTLMSSGLVRPIHIEPVPRPPHACDNKPQGFTCSVTVKLHVIAGGTVDRVEILESSGDRPCDVSTSFAAQRFRFGQEVGQAEYTTTVDSYSCTVRQER